MQLVDELIGIIKSASNYVDTLEQFSPDRPGPYFRMIDIPKRGRVGFRFEAIQLIDKAVASIKKRPDRPQFRVTSENFLQNGLVDIIFNFKTEGKSDNELRQDISKFIKNIQTKKCDCIIPIFNIVVRERQKFGDIKITPEEQLKQELNEYAIPKEEHSRLIEKLKLENKSSALFFLNIDGADIDYAKNYSLTKLEEFLNFLRAFNFKVYSYNGLPMRSQSVLVSCEDKKAITLKQWILDRECLTAPLDFDDFAERLPLDELFKEKPSKSKFLNIRRALVWLGNSTNYQERTQKFLLIVIALESLLLAEKDPTGSKIIIADRCAFLMKDDPAGREDTYNFVIDAYNKRNNIAHGNYTEEIYESTLEKLDRLVLDLAVGLIFDDRFDSIKDIAEYVREKKFQ